jgi:hypothetical protein
MSAWMRSHPRVRGKNFKKYFILFYFILFYFILFYFILFYVFRVRTDT